jgi:hypothetical protein
MPFSTSFCLTNTGSLPSNTTLSFYSNVDGYTVPFQITVPLFSVTGTNCPYTLNGVYDGTTIIKVQSSTGNCCAVINITPNDPCTFCNLGFDLFSASTIGQIVAGNVTGSCDANITDYVIDWYDVTNSNSPVFKFTSGYGAAFTPYTLTHPLINITSVPVLPGIYKPFLRKVRINGINYSYTGGTGTVQADLDCFDTITVNVSPLTCDNGTETGDYSHLIQFSGASVGIQPSPVSTVFQLSPSTNFFAWRFIGYDVTDTIRITYYGSHYNNTPIIMENFTIGNNLTYGGNFSNNQNPKLGATVNDGSFAKIINFTNIVRSTNDYLVIEITPNQTNTRTNFNLQTQCLDTFDCSICWDSFLNTPVQISGSTIQSSLDSCGKLTVQFRLFDCLASDVADSDQWRYLNTQSVSYPSMRLAEGGWTDGTLIYSEVYNQYIYCGGYESSNFSFCSAENNNQITFIKDNSGVGGIGNIYMTFSNINDFNAYYNSYLTWMSNHWPQNYLPSQTLYYISMRIKVPQLDPVSGTTESCGDTSPYTVYTVHPTSIVTTGTTNGLYTLNLTMPIITNQLNFTTCEVNCDYSTDVVVDETNLNSTGTTNNMSNVNNRGNRYVNPFFGTKYLSYSNNSRLSSARSKVSIGGSFIRKTIPMSGSSFTVIPNLSAETCSYVGKSAWISNNFSNGSNDDNYQQAIWWFSVILTNPLNTNDYKIMTTQIVNGQWVGSTYTPTNTFKIYEVQNGVVIYSDPNYII